MTEADDRDECVAPVARMEHLLERMRAQRRQFVTDASHELGTPLTSLRLRLEEAGMHPDETDLSELVGQALQEVDRMQAVLGDLLVLAGLGTGSGEPPSPVDMAELVEKAAGARPRALPVQMDLEGGLIVAGMTGALARLLGNLLDNAERHGESAVRVTVSGEDDQVVVVVDDDGPGIPLPERERVFDDFARIDSARSRDRGGAGLGLPIALAIAQAHGGTLTAEDSDLGGARFVLRLLSLGSDAAPAEAA